MTGSIRDFIPANIPKEVSVSNKDIVIGQRANIAVGASDIATKSLRVNSRHLSITQGVGQSARLGSAELSQRSQPSERTFRSMLSSLSRAVKNLRNCLSVSAARIKSLLNKNTNKASHPNLVEQNRRSQIEASLEKMISAEKSPNLENISFKKLSSDLDIKYNDLQNKVKEIRTAGKPNLPEVSLSSNEKKGINAAKKQIESLEEKLIKKYSQEFNKFPFHGGSSFQRILWQDEEFSKAIADPILAKAILIRGKEGKEAALNPGSTFPITISSLLVNGLAENRISYLTTASPNWAYKPDNIDWKHIRKMNVDSKAENPRIVTKEYLMNIHKGMENLQNILGASKGAPISKPSDFSAEISKASANELAEAFKKLIDSEDKISLLTAGKAGSSTESHKMALQSLEIMENYSALLEKNDNNHSAAMGYGIVSHALDARHLAASLFVLQRGGTETYKQKEGEYETDFKSAKNNLQGLINDANSGVLGEVASTLVTSRLQQILTLVVANKEKLGLTVDQIDQAFKTI